MTTHAQQTLPFPWQSGRQCSLQLLIKPWVCAPGTHYGWVDQGSVEYKVCSTLLHMTSTGNRTKDLLILSPMPYPLGHMLPYQQINILIDKNAITKTEKECEENFILIHSHCCWQLHLYTATYIGDRSSNVYYVMYVICSSVPQVDAL